MSARHIVITEFKPITGAIDVAAADWSALPAPDGTLQREVYVAQDDSTVLEILALTDLSGLADLRSYWKHSWQKLGHHLASDFSRQVLEFVEAPKDCVEPIPTTPYLQLRHVEVPPPAHADYLAWRDRTIFDVVRGASEVEVFLAYHSVISGEPGVLFLSGFSGDVDRYAKVFTSDRYKDIVREAGSQFITGGDKGLYTKIYRRITA